MASLCKILRKVPFNLHERGLAFQFPKQYSGKSCGGKGADKGPPKDKKDKKKGGGDKKKEEEPQVCCTCQCPSDYNPNIPTMYDTRKYSHCLPSNEVVPPFEYLYNIPTGIFRCTAGECLGRQNVGKGTCYQNPEYFSFQHMTYYDMHLILRSCRMPSPRSGRKP